MGIKRQILKILTAGDENVGKSAFLKRIVSNRFFAFESHKIIGVEFSLKEIEFQKKPCVLQLWDFGDKEQFKFLLQSYLLGSKGAFLLFDLTRPTTLDNLAEWVGILRKKEKDLPIMLLGTKNDLNGDTKIDNDYITDLVQKYNLVGFLKISSRSGHNIKKSLTSLLSHIFREILPIPEKVEDVKIEAIELTIKESEKCISEDDRLQPKVGAVLIKNGKIIASAYRGEINPGEHAEYTLLNKKLEGFDFSDSILITTLEPCTVRSSHKDTCAEIIEKCGIKEVIIGVLDPNDEIRGNGILYLIHHGISVGLFEDIYVRKVIKINKIWWDKKMKVYKKYLMKPVKVSINDRLDSIEEKLKEKFQKD